MISERRRCDGILALLAGLATGWIGCADDTGSWGGATDASIENESDDGGEMDGSAVGVDGGLAAALPKFVGNIDTRNAIRSDFVTYWNQYTPENAGKWGSVERTQGAFNWAALDASYQYCNDHDIIFKEHTFVWGSQQPSWTASLTAEDGPATVQRWMTEFCARYPNTKMIDVVNEPPPHTTPAYMNAIGGPGSTGWDWIVNAFTWARSACPNALLVLNDYSNIESASDAQHIVDIVKVLQKAGAPVGAVGCQAHGTVGVSSSTLKANIDRIARETGLPVYITEYDLNIADDAQQAAVMQEQFTLFWNDSNVKGITLWGYVAGSTWQSNTGLIQSDGAFRPAMNWLMTFLGR